MNAEPPREITTHKTNGCNDAITLTARDEPGIGGASHHYRMVIAGGKRPKPTIDELQKILDSDSKQEVELRPDGRCDVAFFQEIFFQNGAIAEVGTNGITHEALLAILIDRLEGFQSGQFVCEENEAALDYLRKALLILHKRTARRINLGVEGTLTV